MFFVFLGVGITIPSLTFFVCYRLFSRLDDAAATRPQQHEPVSLAQPQESPVTRAARLLEAHLTPGQLASYQQRGMFITRGADGKSYAIRAGGGVYRVGRDGTVFDRFYCIHEMSGLYLPSDDVALILKLMIEDKRGLKKMLKTANGSQYHGPVRAPHGIE